MTSCHSPIKHLFISTQITKLKYSCPPTKIGPGFCFLPLLSPTTNKTISVLRLSFQTINQFSQIRSTKSSDRSRCRCRLTSLSSVSCAQTNTLIAISRSLKLPILIWIKRREITGWFDGHSCTRLLDFCCVYFLVMKHHWCWTSGPKSWCWYEWRKGFGIAQDACDCGGCTNDRGLHLGCRQAASGKRVWRRCGVVDGSGFWDKKM